ncbi:nibrin [Pimephales promelas]|uniref:nibrin n=1 Tax=Pimephales promelas TaxID=90988 RepID=UPI00195568FC|nr:nibrin [Pimephales promelas]KAG1947646.1 nibrin [Pimephales promelas]KAG1947647.1 nibrin [Pimephales promelas]
MWKLQTSEAGGECVVLLPGQEYVVGRKNCEILLSNDQSISRVHAKLTVTEQAVTLKDSSKYGTFINDEKLETGSTKTLQTGDKITFGVFQSKFSLEKECSVVCSSCLDNEGKASLSQDVHSIGGQLVNSWTLECTHLVMPTVKVTIKTICALLCCRPIVKPEFFSAFSKAVQQKLPMPKAERFRPPIDEPSLAKEDVDLSARPERQSLFKGKTFLFLNSKQMKRLSLAVSCGGGMFRLLDEGSLPVSLLESSSTCVVDMISGNSQVVIPPNSKKWVDSVAQILHRNGLRFITESEIGLAAIHVNNQTYCNPCSSIQSESVKVKTVIAAATLSQNNAVDETALAAPSQNITAYVVNTELSQDPSRMVRSGMSAVGETPEKTRPAKNVEKKEGSTLSATHKSSSLGPEPSTFHIISETVRSSESCSMVEPEQRMKKGSAPSARGQVEFEGSGTAPLNGSTTLKQSPQKQTALTNFFQASGKKRPREDSANSIQSEIKIFRKDCENKKDEIQQNSSAQNQHSSVSKSEFSASLGQACGSSQNSGSKKRKEPELDVPSAPEEPDAAADLEMSLEELESIMSDEMDEPPCAAANKKQRLELGPNRTSSNPQLPNQQEGTESKSRKDTRNNIQNLQLDRTGPASTNQGSERQSKQPPNQTPDLAAHGSANKGKRPELEDVKEEEVSFVVNSRTQIGISQHSASVANQEVQASTSKTGSENDAELPRSLIQLQFKSLTVSTSSSRSRPGPLQTRDSNAKNVKTFRKANVPGFNGLPNIIGGSDLVAHNRSKNSELEEWLKQATEEEKQNEREEILGEDLFRYNPKPAKRR